MPADLIPPAPAHWGPIRALDCVDSTMLTARAWALDGAREGSTLVAERQRAGRGRQGRSWASAAATGLWCTLVLRPPPRADIASLGLVAGLAVRTAVAQLGAPQAQLKWPNDVLVGGRKLAGVLLELASAADGAAPLVLVGMGINIAPAATLPPPLRLQAIGLQDLPQLAAQPVRRLQRQLLPLIRGCLAQYYTLWRARGLAPLLGRWAAVDALAGRWVQLADSAGPVQGVAWGPDLDGALRLQRPSGQWTAVRTGVPEMLGHPARTEGL